MRQEEEVLAEETVHLQAEFPAAGTSLNPDGDFWVFPAIEKMGVPGESE
jgi:hypothetical protein